MDNTQTNSHIFTNRGGNTLMREFEGVLSNNPTIKNLDAVVGFLRASGYFSLRPFLDNINKVRVLIGIDVDRYIVQAVRRGSIFYGAEESIKNDTLKLIREDIERAGYKKEIEEGIIQMVIDLKEGKLKLRSHPSRKIHAKLYILYPDNFNQHTLSTAITGSSNLTGNGLGISQDKQYEFNVKMSDYDDVKFSKDEFEMLWEEAKDCEITAEDVENELDKTYLKGDVSPYEIYMKVLINVFGDQVEDNFTLELPQGIMDLKYQNDAVVQGYQMMMKHNGVFIADVVGLGKTIIATMIAKRYIEENGNKTKILVVYPPAVKENWVNTFKNFGIKERRNARFISNGSLSKVMDEKEEFDLVIVDEAHGFRNDESGKYEALQKICKSSCSNPGALNDNGKKVLLLSATPLNNSPEDLHNLLLLFQDDNACTIDGIPQLKPCFSKWEKKYRKIMRDRHERSVTSDVNNLYDEIRNAVIDKVTIRRTRNNILNSPEYKEDLDKQGIHFPTVAEPQVQTYKMSKDTSELFYRTIHILSKDETDTDEDDTTKETHQPKVLTYARYRAVEFLNADYRKRYPTAVHIGQTLKGIYRVHMVKRLESSFYAFKKSLNALLKATENMIKMFDENKVLIIPALKINDKMEQGLELDEILEKAIKKGYVEDDIRYGADCFLPEFIEMLYSDRDLLKALIADWENVKRDPKFDTFRQGLEKETYYADKNSRKLVVFSESVDTLNYLYGKLTEEMGKTDVLKVTAKDRRAKEKKIKANFDAIIEKKKWKNDFNIILTSDVLAEGVNLHRSNVIVNYDSPWNAIRLMQRIGRVNRIGSQADTIHNYMFYPSQQGDREIRLYKNALIKLQGFHSAFGEDAQIYSTEEIVRDFKLFNSDVKDSVDDKIEFLREARQLFNTNRELYQKIKNLPLKSRVMRASQKHSGETIIFVQSDVKTEFYDADDKAIKIIDFIQAAKTLKATPDEKPVSFNHNSSKHYEFVNKAVQEFRQSYEEQTDTLSVNNTNLDNKTKQARNFIAAVKRELPNDPIQATNCQRLIEFIERGRFNNLPRTVNTFTRKNKLSPNPLSVQQNLNFIIKELIAPLTEEYCRQVDQSQQENQHTAEPQIIISETFV